MNSRIPILLIAFSFVLSSCEEPIDEGECLEEPIDEEEECLTAAGDVLLPLAKGNYWTREQLSYGDGVLEECCRDTGKIAIEKMMTVEHQGVKYYVGIHNLHYPVDQPREVSRLYWNGPDGLYLLGGISPTDTLVQPVLELKYPVEVGESWEVPRLQYYETGRKFVFSDSLKTTYTCVAVDEPYETPVDTFQCIVYYYSYRPAEDVLNLWHYFRYYAPGVGEVGTLIYSSSDSTYAWEDRDLWDLRWKLVLFDYCLK